MGLPQGEWVAWLRNALAVLALVLAVVVAVESALNRAAQDKVNAGRAELARAQTFANLDNGLVQLLAKTAAERRDAQIQGLLARNGVTYRIEPKPAGASPAPAGTQGAGR